MTRRLYVTGFFVTPQVVMADDETETAVPVEVSDGPVFVRSAPELADWAARRWPVDFEQLKARHEENELRARAEEAAERSRLAAAAGFAEPPAPGEDPHVTFPRGRHAPGGD